MIKKNKFSILVALIILYLSLASSDTIDSVSFFDISFVDKIAHFGMYWGFMSVIILENRNLINSNLHLFLSALIPFAYGILMEFFQLTLSSGRSASFFDILFNIAGILVSVLLWLWLKPHLTGRVRS
jgi:VanZ family protein